MRYNREFCIRDEREWRILLFYQLISSYSKGILHKRLLTMTSCWLKNCLICCIRSWTISIYKWISWRHFVMLSTTAHYCCQVISVCCQRTSPKYLFKCFPELSRHATIYEKLQRMTQYEKKIGKQYTKICQSIIEKTYKQWTYHMECRYDCQWYFNNKKHRHNNNKHEGCAILIVSALRFFTAFIEELLSFLLGYSHGTKQ